MKRLYVYLHEDLVGELLQEKGTLSFLYRLDQPICQEISQQLPLREEIFTHQECHSFFSGLLPDEPIRSTISRILKVSPQNTFALLEHLGGDCAGAITILPNDDFEETPSQKKKDLSIEDLYQILKDLPQRPLGIGHNGVRVSGAGAQNKLMVVISEEGIGLPLFGTPSTHIIKPNITGFPNSVQNEFFCMRLAKKIGLLTPDVQILNINQESFYMIERYDREKQASRMRRLHQEDFCQILNIPPDQKYQNEGGPSIKALFDTCMDLQRQGKMKGIERLTLLRLVLFNFFVGNGDAHGKNFSILYKGSGFQLAPCYDILSTLLYYDWHTERMAMKIGSKYKFKDVIFRHFETMASEMSFPPKILKRELLKMTQKLPAQAKELQRELNEEGIDNPIFDDIIAIIEKLCSISIS